MNVYSMSNKLIELQQYVNDYGIDVIFITQTHIHVDGYKQISIEGMTRVSTSCRTKGRSKGGVAIYVSKKIPCIKEYSTITLGTLWSDYLSEPQCGGSVGGGGNI